MLWCKQKYISVELIWEKVDKIIKMFSGVNEKLKVICIFVFNCIFNIFCWGGKDYIFYNKQFGREQIIC